MNCTVTTGRLFLGHEDRQAPHGELPRVAPGDPPIYAALVREWRADGRLVPGTPNPQWDAHAPVDTSTTGQLKYSTIPPYQGRWERVAEAPPGHRVELVTAR
ncbi:hypothetical protein ACFWWC_41650 [Streptomyces sp. NPDC058642]|uniref:hypothetical protein n=1 Tax=Streptomyces sp. NPDC058642 TaxID=3346572 RepID=UPI0036475C1F